MAMLYCHNYLISLVRLDRQRKLLMRTDVKRREIWEWSDHTLLAKLPKDVQPQATQRLQAIWLAPDRQRAELAFDLFIAP